MQCYGEGIIICESGSQELRGPGLICAWAWGLFPFKQDSSCSWMGVRCLILHKAPKQYIINLLNKVNPMACSGNYLIFCTQTHTNTHRHTHSQEHTHAHIHTYTYRAFRKLNLCFCQDQIPVVDFRNLGQYNLFISSDTFIHWFCKILSKAF